MELNFQYYPKSIKMPDYLDEVVQVFKCNYNKISSDSNNLKSNDVLLKCKDGLKYVGYIVEEKQDDKTVYIEVPVLFGKNNTLEKSFKADAYNKETKTVIEIEAGRAVINNQFLKDLFQACMMQDVEHLVIAVRNEYKVRTKEGTQARVNYDFQEVCKFFDALYASDRLKLPLKGIVVIGY